MKINKRRLLFAATMLAVLIVFIVNIPGIYDFFMYSDYEEVDNLIGSDYSARRYGGDILAYNNMGMSQVSAKGEIKWSVAISTTSPGVYIGDEYILLADLSGNRAYLYKGDKLKATVTTEEGIFGAGVDDSGNFALVTKKQGYKGSVTVYDSGGKAQYEWDSGGGYISGISIRKNKIALSQISADEDALKTKIIIIDRKKNQEKLCQTKTDELVFDIKFQASGDFIAVSEKSLTGFKESGDVRFTVDFSGRELRKYNIESDDNLVLCFSGDQNNSIIESYSKRGKLRGSYVADGDISGIDASGEAILISNMRSVIYLEPDGDEGGEVVSRHDVRGIKMFANRRHALITGNSRATVVKINR